MANSNPVSKEGSSEALARIEARAVSADDAMRVIEVGASLKLMRAERDAGRPAGERDVQSAFDDAVSFERIKHPSMREQATAVLNISANEFPKYASELKRLLPSALASQTKDDKRIDAPSVESPTVRMVREDIADIRSIQDKKDRKEALQNISNNVELSDLYKATLQLVDSKLAATVNREGTARKERSALDTIRDDVKQGASSSHSPHERAMRDSELYQQIENPRRREQARQAIAEGIDKEPAFAQELRAHSPAVYNQAASPEPRPAATKEAHAAEKTAIDQTPTNSIVEVSDREPTIRYTVGRLGKPGQTFKDPAEVAARYVDIPPAERPFVMREVTDHEGRTTVAFVGGTQLRGREGASSVEKVIAAELDQSFAREVNNRTPRNEPPPRNVGVDSTKKPAGELATNSKEANSRELEEQRRTLDGHFHRRGREFRFNQNTEVVAFVESKMFERASLTTKHNDNELVVKAMLDRADDKRWKAIEVIGTPEFKQHVWLEASARGKGVVGYEPSQADLARLQERIDRGQVRNAISPTREVETEQRGSTPNNRDSSTRNSPPTFSGQVVDMGNAPYKHKKDEPESYYITMRDENGRDKTIWGKDLERAAAAAELKVGERVADIRRTEREPVTVKANVRDEHDHVVGQERKTTHLNHWEIKKAPRELSGVEEGLVNHLERNAPENLRDRVRAEAHRQLDDMASVGLQPKVGVYDTRQNAPQRQREPRVIEVARPEPTHSH